jgi:enolase
MGEKTITEVCAREIIDCRGWPTVQADVCIGHRLMGRADVASGR